MPVSPPIQDIALLQNRLNSVFSDFGRQTAGDNESLSSMSFIPPVDIYEDGQKLSIRMEIPGVKIEDIDVRVENNTLTVRGERRFTTEDKEENFHRIERRYGSFTRTFNLPQTFETENVAASCEDGILTIELPKKAEAKPKQIKVAVNAKAKQMDASASN
ncbi:MAG TPA: Hsp20/alpha crystallin family protein [Acidobacteriaceae bacterium]